MEEVDGAGETGRGCVGDLDQDRHVLGLDAMLVRRAAIAEVVAQFDRARYGVADPGQDLDRLGSKIDPTVFVITHPGQHLLADVPCNAMRSFGIAAAILPTSPIKCRVSAGSSS